MLGIVAIVLFIFTIFTIESGTEGPNDYGLDPDGPDGLEKVFA